MAAISQLRIAYPSNAVVSTTYRSDIDGLRAVAILPVVLFHAKAGFFSGGFVGVDVLFVISGYLITSLIHKDVAAGRFSLSFYERRIRRIFPALLAVSVLCMAAAVVLLAPANLARFGKSRVAMTFFSSNIYFKRSAGTDGYFSSDMQALVHTWSLSVEEQFYLLFL